MLGMRLKRCVSDEKIVSLAILPPFTVDLFACAHAYVQLNHLMTLDDLRVYQFAKIDVGCSWYTWSDQFLGSSLCGHGYFLVSSLIHPPHALQLCSVPYCPFK
jgi:hypothetical protein